MICPILKAGTMVDAIYLEPSGMMKHLVHSKEPICIDKDCVWYKKCFGEKIKKVRGRPRKSDKA